MRLALINSKPGTAKTTSAMFLSAALHAYGRRVLLVDADPGGSALRWVDLAGGVPWSVAGLATKQIARQLDTMTARGDWDVVVIDAPQVEDHAAIARGALKWSDDWVVPVAPAGIELDRATAVIPMLDEIDGERPLPAGRWALLNRCNRRRPSKEGPDTQTRTILRERGFGVFGAQVQHADAYRQAFGTVPDATDTPYAEIAEQLITTGSHHHAATA